MAALFFNILQQLSLYMASPKQNITTPMIAELKKALKLLEDETDQKKKDIKTWLAQKKPVSMEDEEWLDVVRNLVDEVGLVESLAATHDLNLHDPYLHQLEGFLASFG
ncbi:hypothetical protein F5146DRAFT_1129352 [Armillaria mellea]|nr:hypothetical protein F5146DRAFT_1129352 [Armillaria mellea]